MFKIKDGYKLELQIPGTIKTFGNTKKLIGKIKKRETTKSWKVVEVVLIQCNLVNNQYQHLKYQSLKNLHSYAKEILCLFVKCWTK